MINFRMTSQSPVFDESMQLLHRHAELEKRMTTLCERAEIPSTWSPAKQAIALLLMSGAPDISLLEDLYQRVLRTPQDREGPRVSHTYLHQMESELDKVEMALGHVERRGMDGVGKDSDSVLQTLRGERLPGGCCALPHGWIWADAALNGLANAIGYLFGSVAQSCIEDGICNRDQELPYGMRVLAELGNRTVQHMVRFLLRDVLFPWIKHVYQWHSLQTERHLSPGQTVLLNASIIAPLLAGDQVGVAILTNLLPSVPLQGSHQTPEKWESGAQMMVFAGTDFLAWVGANYFSQLCYGSAPQVQGDPRQGLEQKGIIHAAQVVMDGLVLSSWKHAHDGLNPNSLCLPGIDTQRVRLYNGNITALPPLNRTETRQPMKYNDTHAIFPGALLDEMGRAPEYRLYAVYLDLTEIGTMLAIGNREAVGRTVAMAVVRCLVPQVFEDRGPGVEGEGGGGGGGGGGMDEIERGADGHDLQARHVRIALHAGGDDDRRPRLERERGGGMEEVAIRGAQHDRQVSSQFSRRYGVQGSGEDVQLQASQTDSSEEDSKREGKLREPNVFTKEARRGYQ